MSKWHPKYWGVYPLLACLWLLAHLPYQLRLKVGSGLGWLYYHLAGEARKIAFCNIKLCFPDLSSEEQIHRVKASFKHLATSLIETTFMPVSDKFPLELMLGHIEGMDQVIAAQKLGKGIIILFPHLSSIFFVGYLCWRLSAFEFGFMFREQKHPVLSTQFKKQFADRIQSFTRKEAKQMLAYLQAGGIVWYAPDLLPKRHEHVFAPFLGVDTATGIAPIRMAALTGAAVIPIGFHRDSQGKFSLRFFKALENFPSGDHIKDATLINAAMAEAILAFPEGYLWIYKRFAMSKPGQASPYQDL